jgi:hypothetical protein
MNERLGGPYLDPRKVIPIHAKATNKTKITMAIDIRFSERFRRSWKASLSIKGSRFITSSSKSKCYLPLCNEVFDVAQR